jgi:hypothetical protein
MNSLTVTEIIARSIENGCKEIVRKSVMKCGEKYGFDGSEACVWLEIDGLKLERKVMRRSKGKKTAKSSLVLPFSKENVNELGCKGLKYNGGLYTQCSSVNLTKGNRFCNGCEKEGNSNGTGIPDNGCVEDRLKVGLMEFKDPKGRSPKEYSKVMKKQNLSEEEVRREAGNNNYIIDDIHFEKKVKKENKENKEEVTVTGKKGRPKKEKKEVEVEKVKDIFAELVEDTINNERVITPRLEEVVEKVEEVEEVEKVEKVEEPLLIVKKAKKEKKVEFKEESEESKDKEEEKKAKKANKKLLEQKKKKEEEEAKAKALKEEEEAKAKAKALKEEEEAKAKSLKGGVLGEPSVPLPQKVTVTRFEFEGKKYLKSSENILYDPETKDEMGIWCEETKSIKELPEDEDDDEEMEEEDYE